MTYRDLKCASARRAGLVLVAGLALTLAGCNRDDAAAQAIDKASIDLHSLAPGGANPPAREFREARYRGVITALQPVSKSGTKAENAAAAILIAQAQAGLAIGPAAEAADLERRSLIECTELRTLLGQWSSFNALARASAGFDPAPELGEIARQVKEREEERVDLQRQKAAIDQQVAGLQGQAQEHAAAAKMKRQEAGTLRAQVPTQTAVQGEQTLKQAQEIGRAGDALEVEAADLDAQAAKIAPQSGEIQLQIDRVSDQLRLLDAAKADVMKRAEAARARDAEARAEADKVAAEISKRHSALEKLREDLAKAAEEAINQLRASGKSADNARSEARTTALMTYGAAQQSLGDMLWSRAQDLTAYADTLEALAAAQPPLPESGAYKTRAEEARAAAKIALEQATEAYEAANEAYKAGGTSVDNDRLDRINQRLAKAVSATSGGAKDIRNPDAAPQETPSEAPSETGAAAPEAGSPQATIVALAELQKKGDLGAVAGYFHFSNSGDRRAFAGMLNAVGPAFQRLDKAMKAKFGEGMDQMAGGMGGGMGAGAMPGLDQLDPANLQFKIEGDTATADGPNGQSLKMRRVDGKWLVDGDSMGLKGEQLAAAAAMMPAMAQAANEVAADVESGKIKSAQEVGAVLMQKVMGAAMQNMPKGKK